MLTSQMRRNVLPSVASCVLVNGPGLRWAPAPGAPAEKVNVEQESAASRSVNPEKAKAAGA
jgi:hypothetical protein